MADEPSTDPSRRTSERFHDVSLTLYGPRTHAHAQLTGHRSQGGAVDKNHRLTLVSYDALIPSHFVTLKNSSSAFHSPQPSSALPRMRTLRQPSLIRPSSRAFFKNSTAECSLLDQKIQRRSFSPTIRTATRRLPDHSTPRRNRQGLLGTQVSIRRLDGFRRVFPVS